jgi:hypothetical protein
MHYKLQKVNYKYQNKMAVSRKFAFFTLQLSFIIATCKLFSKYEIGTKGNTDGSAPIGKAGQNEGPLSPEWKKFRYAFNN